MKQTPVKTLKVSNFLDDFEKDKVREKADIVVLFESFGISLTAKGKAFTGLCPWHEDSTPSLSVDREKGLYNCFGCGESGDVFSLVEKMKGVSFKEALTYLKTGSFPAYEPKPTVKPVPSSSVTPDLQSKSGVLPLDANNLLASVAEFYAKELTTNREAQSYLDSRKLLSWEVLKRLGVGFAAGNLSDALSENQKAQLVELGVLWEDSKKEVFAGCIVVPLKDSTGKVVSFYARRITDKDPKHLYLKGSHRGLVNAEALTVWREEILLTESILDAISLLSIGVQNVLPCYGTNGFTDDHLRALKDAAVKKVVIAFDADEPGAKGADKLKEKLIDEGFTVAVIVPQGAKDWNEAAVNGLRKEEVEALVRSAEVFAKIAPSAWKYNPGAGRWELVKDGLSYKVVGVKERLGASLRVNVRIEKDGKRFLDHVDLYSSRSRNTFKDAVAGALSIEAALVEGDLLALLDKLEEQENKDESTGEVKMTSGEIETGLAFLKNPRLLEEIVDDLTAIGYVGEERNKELLYLAATSRKMDDPLSVMVTSQSAAGKSFLIDCVRKLLPPEDVVNFTSVSDQALNYMAEGALMHKFVVMGEAVHSEVVEHQIREMLSAKELSRLVVSKDEKTGKMTSQMVYSPAVVSVAMSTTSSEVNPENLSRFFVASADESAEQTKRIHEAQRNKYSLVRHSGSTDKEKIVAKHQAGQRLLTKVRIVNPFAQFLDFPDKLMRSRRDHERFLDLIASVCFLRQYQKQVKKEHGLEFIECDLDDYRVAYTIIEGVLAPTLTNFPQAAQSLYKTLCAWAKKKAEENGIKSSEVTMTQRQLRDELGLGQMFLKRYLAVLVEYEYVLRGGIKTRGARSTYYLAGEESMNLVDTSMIPTPQEMAVKISNTAKVGQVGQSGFDPLSGG